MNTNWPQPLKMDTKPRNPKAKPKAKPKGRTWKT